MQHRKLSMKRGSVWVAGRLALCLGASLPLFAAAPAPAQETVAQPAAPKPDFFAAIQRGDAKVVAQILKDDPSQANAVSDFGWTALLTAIRQSNIEMVSLLLDAKADPNKTDNNRQPPLSAALDNGRKEMVSLLVDKGADANAFGREGRTSLTQTIGSGNREMVEILLQKGVKPDVLDRRGMLPLSAAILNNSKDLVSLLLEKGAQVSARTSSGATPLHAALWRDNPDTLRLLLQKGADPNAATKNGETPLHFAVLRPGAAVKILLDAGADPGRRDSQGDLPLHVALHHLNSTTASETIQSLSPQEYRGYVSAEVAPDVPSDTVETVLAPLIAKSDMNARDRLGVSPLLLAVLAREPVARDLINARKPRTDATTQLFDAVAGGDNSTVERLLAAKPFLAYFRLPDGTTPLHVAALWGARGAAELLLKKGADINARDARGATPLQVCMERASGQFARRMRTMVELLLQRKADLNTRDLAERTPLLSAARVGNYALLAQLMDAKAEVSALDEDGKTPLHLLSALPRKDAPQGAAPDGGANREDAANADVSESEIVGRLVAAGVALEARDKDENTALITAVNTRRVATAQALLRGGANPNAEDRSGFTPFASLSNNFYNRDDAVEALVRALLEKGVNPNASAMWSNESVLTRAVQSSNKPLVALLLEYKADPNFRAGRNYSPLMYAVMYGQKETAEMLLNSGGDVNARTNDGQTVLSLAQRSGNKDILALVQAKIDAQVDAQKAK